MRVGEDEGVGGELLVADALDERLGVEGGVDDPACWGVGEADEVAVGGEWAEGEGFDAEAGVFRAGSVGSHGGMIEYRCSERRLGVEMALIRNIDEVDDAPVSMAGAERVRMALMVGREDGAPNFSLRSFRVEPGGHSPRHAHDYEHEVFVVAGGGEVLLEGEYRPIKAGDVVFVPADEEHQFRAGDGGLRFLCLVPVTRNCGETTPGS